MEKAVAKGSGGGQNGIHTTGGTWATCMCRQWVSRTQADGPAGQLSREEERKFKKNRMTAMPSQGAGLLWKEPGYWVEGEPVPPCWVTPGDVLSPGVGAVEDNSRKKSEFKVRLSV